jgi:translation initiation factor IF-1
VEGVRYKRSKMVKNQFGGSKSKGLARKNEKEVYNRRLRMPECEEEKFAIVKKIYGGDMCEVMCEDNIVRIGVIRGKFSGGKGKRHNLIAISTLVLVGLRSWATSNTDKKDKEYLTSKIKTYMEENPLNIDFIANYYATQSPVRYNEDLTGILNSYNSKLFEYLNNDNK